MNSNTDKQLEVEETPCNDEPDENTGIVVQGFFKISDPESGEIILQGRA